MTNLGFSWGFEPKFESSGSGEQYEEQVLSPVNYNNSRSVRSKKIPAFTAKNSSKRKRGHDEEEAAPRLQNPRRIKSWQGGHKHKKVRNQHADIIGKELPINRLVELLDKKQLSEMVLKLINEKPELNQIIYSESGKQEFGMTRPSVENSLRYLSGYIQDKIISKLPYKVDPESEYSFLRVQKNLVEFYLILSDFILNFLPPVENNFINCLNFIDGATNVIHRVPFFQVNKFHLYHYTNIYEQLSNAWWNILNTYCTNTGDNEVTPSENDMNVFHMLEFNLLEKLQQHQNLSKCDKFDKLIEFVKKKVDEYQLTNGESLINPGLSLTGTMSGYPNAYYDSYDRENSGENEECLSTNFSSGNNPVNHNNYAIMDSTLH